HPYLLGDAWLRNADAEYTALCLAPFALAGLLRARAQPRSAVLWIAAGLALVVLAHNLSGLWLAAVCAGATALSAGRSGGGRAAAPLATPISVQLWELVPLLPLYQFPWRFAGPAALFAALAVALLVSWTSASLGRRAALVLELLLFALCTLQALPRLLQYEPLPAPVRDRLEPA